MDWLKRLFSRKAADTAETKDPFAVWAAAEMAGRDVAPVRLIELVAPPVTLKLDPAWYGPDEDVEVVARFTADRAFPCSVIENALYGEAHKGLLCPTYYVVTPDGETTYMTAKRGPREGRELIAGWVPGQVAGATPDRIRLAQRDLAVRLERLGFGFKGEAPDQSEVAAKFRLVTAIEGLAPDEIGITAWPRHGDRFDGRGTWNLLHALGFRWGDMDCFQWADPTGQTDSLIWVEADDGETGCVSPQWIAEGGQHFGQVRFSMTPPRTPSPRHVADQMIRAATAFQQQTGCRLTATLDSEDVDGLAQLREAVAGMEIQINRLGLTAGGPAICRVR